MEKKHVPTYSSYIMIWFGLVVLTALTVTAAGLHFGQWSVLAAIVIATVKSCLVLFYFMHLRYESVLFKLMLLIALLTLTVIMVLTFADVSFR